MLTKRLEKALNDQMNFEIYSAHIYLAMAGYCAELGLEGFENWFLVQYEEELFHAKKFFKFISSKGGRIIITGFENPENDYPSLLSVYEKSLEHEQLVTSRIYDLMSIAHEEKEYATTSFLQWFIDEQLEEEESVANIISKIKLVKDAGLYLLDQEVAQRTFVPPTGE
ncbi:ferritin [Mycoplasmatota bacterium]|nr:ferritin [Mycoplasmatota bacterium]